MERLRKAWLPWTAADRFDSEPAFGQWLRRRLKVFGDLAAVQADACAATDTAALDSGITGNLTAVDVNIAAGHVYAAALAAGAVW